MTSFIAQRSLDIFDNLTTSTIMRSAHPDLNTIAKYRLTVCDSNYETELEYIVELGEPLSKLSEPLQKRWVRKRVEQEFGRPVKNPTQKRYVWEPYFRETRLYQEVKDFSIPVWKVIIKLPGDL